MLEVVHISLQRFQKTFHMVSIGSGVVTGEGKGQKGVTILLPELSSFYRREIVRFILITVDSEMGKIDPGNAGNGIGIFRGWCLGLAQYAVNAAEMVLIVQKML